MTAFHSLEKEVFAEGAGLVLANPTMLGEMVNAHGENLLELFAGTDEGDVACRAGATVPVIGLSLGYYDVSVGSSPNTGLVTAVQRAQNGWVLRVDQEPILLCGLGYLSRWDARSAHHRALTIPPGWYAVQVRGGLGTESNWGMEFELEACDVKPAFTADLSRAFDMYLD